MTPHALAAPPPTLAPRGLRVEQAAHYFRLESLLHSRTDSHWNLPAIGGPGSGTCAAYIVLREHLDEYLDALGEQAVERADERRKERKAA